MDELLRERIPWMSQGAIDAMKKWNMRGMKVLEWGSGGSTLFFLDKGAKVVSIEHDVQWYNKIAAIIRSKDDQFVRSDNDQWKRSKLCLIKPDEKETLWGVSAHTPQHTFSRYVKYAFEAVVDDEDSLADVVVIDGRARPACLRIAPRLLRPGGRIVLDDADRLRYKTAISDMLSSLIRPAEYKFIGPGPMDGGRTRHTYIWRERL